MLRARAPAFLRFCLLGPEGPRASSHCRRPLTVFEPEYLLSFSRPSCSLDSMAPAGSTNWTAQVGAAIATLHVIPLLERDLPGQEFILGGACTLLFFSLEPVQRSSTTSRHAGLQAIAFYAQALNERRRHDISAALPQRALPTNELVRLAHALPCFSRRGSGQTDSSSSRSPSSCTCSLCPVRSTGSRARSRRTRLARPLSRCAVFELPCRGA